MRNRWFVNLILLVMVGMLSLLIIFTPGLKKPAPELPSLTELNAKQVKLIRIEQVGKSAIELTKDAQNVWQMTVPLAVEANDFRIHSILELLATKRYKKLEVSTLKLDELQLTPPKIKVTFDSLVIAMGATSPVDETQRYVQINQDIFLVTDTFYEFLKGEAEKFATLAVLGKNPKITELRTPNYHLTLENSTWKLLENKQENVETGADALNTMIDNWQHAQAINVNSYQDQAGAQQGEAVVKLGDRTVTLQIVSIAPEFILALPDKKIQYQLANHQVEKLLHLPIKKATETPATPAESSDISEPVSPPEESTEPSEPVDPDVFLERSEEEEAESDAASDVEVAPVPPTTETPSAATPAMQ
jgi:Domain of unknown function (DUF4340)